MRPKLVFLSPFVYLELKINSFCGLKDNNFELTFLLKKDPNLKKNDTKS